MNKKLLIAIIIAVFISLYMSSASIIQTNQIQKQLIGYEDTAPLEQKITVLEQNVGQIVNFINQSIKQAQETPAK